MLSTEAEADDLTDGGMQTSVLETKSMGIRED